MFGNPIVIAYHLMWTLYGWWLPNDPRGSTSQIIRNDLLADLGELHHGRKRIQPAGRDIKLFYQQAAEVLRYPLLAFHPGKFAAVADAIGGAVRVCGYTCYGLAVTPDHVHLVIRKHRDLAEEMIEKTQTLSRKRLIEIGMRSADHPTWTRGGWKVFLDHPDEIWRTIHYVEQNPVKMGLPIQHWPFITPYDNWPLHKSQPTTIPRPH